ncbi:TIGR03560 family F420-dependent LLM class oxidoreductase [Amycolatopsis nigrescens]|uniref:TIGR03560 family F420-dependent LLM class oxidoreductase n=1 Tax=Amycolatopsis nigrescens TaxID=381445 RepID=UPI0003735B73|nr:TIGR03560 family F420-dependent LLM class oxidoreductase [Amycolatopsis nigrescens]
MKVGLEFGEFAWAGGPAQMADTIARFARTADESGVDLLGVGDHLWQGPHAGGPEQPWLECFTTLTLMAANTRRCRLAPIVAGVHFREPALLAKAVTNLDILSGGRAMLGVGAGWDADEASGMGIGFPGVAERFDRLDETLQVCLRLWESEPGAERPFTGRYYQLERPLLVPQSLTRPHPPIMVAGGGERRTLRLVARYADACNLYPSPDLADKLEILRGHCATEGRDYDAIEKTIIMPFDLGPDGERADELAETLRGFTGLGVHTAIGIIFGPDPVAQAEIVGNKIVPALA